MKSEDISDEMKEIMKEKIPLKFRIGLPVILVIFIILSYLLMNHLY